MNKTTFAQTFSPNRVAAIIERDGERIGHVVMRGARFNGSRKVGSADDIRRMASFKSAEAAAAWVAKADK